MNLTVNNSQPNFNAKLQLRGNISLLDNNGVRTIKKITDKIGSNTDIIDINLPDKFSKNKANANIAGYVNGVLEQYTVSTEKASVSLWKAYVFRKTPLREEKQCELDF